MEILMPLVQPQSTDLWVHNIIHDPNSIYILASIKTKQCLDQYLTDALQDIIIAELVYSINSFSIIKRNKFLDRYFTSTIKIYDIHDVCK